jgi:organic hydroperoxide reductase OsmC/OhrA
MPDTSVNVCLTATLESLQQGRIMSEQVGVSMSQWQNFQFLIDFNQDGVTDLLTDEEPPLGQGKGPDPTALLAAAVGNCLSSSLLFCLRKARIQTSGLNCVVEAETTRNEKGRLRVGQLRVRIEPALSAADADRISQCSQLFEDFCTVTNSVRNGIDVRVEVAPQTSEDFIATLH